MDALPIDASLPAIQNTLAKARNLVLVAPPGAGKTTRVPLALLDASWLGNAKIILVEPRRIAARGAARRMAQALAERVGETIGWRMRLDTKVSPATRIEVVTDGLLTRRLHADPELAGIGAILFDEVHERRLESDLGLALALEAQAALRPDLRLVAMSATLEAQGFARVMAADVIEAQGRAYPIELRYVEPLAQRIEDDVAATVRLSLARDQGDILVFLPGAAEIQRTRRALGDLGPLADVHVLHGDLAPEAQDRAVKPGPKRKVILSSAIAETSLTIDGVAVVIDSGLRRVARFDPATGMDRLVTLPVTLANADQRAGRAGRLGPGIAYRLWPEARSRGLLPRPAPEILDSDLAPLALDLAAWGGGASLAFLDPPPTAGLNAARDLLRDLDLLDEQGALTAAGRAAHPLGLHPRLAHMVIAGRARGLGRLAALLAAILSERDGHRGQGADVMLRVDGVLRGHDEPTHRIKNLARLWTRPEDPHLSTPSPDDVGTLIALAYPDRVAGQRGAPGAFRLSRGQGATLDPLDPLARADYLAIADLDGPAGAAKIRLAAALSRAALEDLFAARLERQAIIAWDAKAQAVKAEETVKLGALVLEQRALFKPDPQAVLAALIEGLRAEGPGALPLNDAARQIQARVALVRRSHGELGFPDMSDEALLANLDVWLGPDLLGKTRRAHVRDIDGAQALRRLLPYPLDRHLERLAPTHIEVPSGSRLAIDYQSDGPPILAVKVQEMFGARDHPTIAEGRVKLSLHLLSPAQRPVQVTGDLPGFWTTSYAAVHADLRGRYPKHPWPDDPLSAQPTRHTKKRAP